MRAAFGAGDSIILTESADGLVTVWDVRSGEILYTLEDVMSAEFSPTSDKIIIGTGHGKAMVLNAETGEKLLEIEIPFL